MISKELSTALGFAVREAKKRRHEYVCVEHVLYAILNHEAGAQTIEKCGGSPEQIKEELEKFFDEKLTKIDTKEEYVLQQTIGFQRMIQRAINHARSAEKSEVNLGVILASIFQEKDSHAAFYLESEGITRLDVLKYISHTVEPDKKNNPLMDPSQKAFRPDDMKTKRQKKKDPLESFTTDLLQKARDNKIDPLIGRI
ncbi:MAG: ATP-dependent Clp protease ATP-binding subunit ClpA, partial [Proteobacteria bacterium]|nr:ATP-dependent Clp protease ATP-binding subunit ClpA [Pseudomonadota bacterium]